MAPFHDVNVGDVADCKDVAVVMVAVGTVLVAVVVWSRGFHAKGSSGLR